MPPARKRVHASRLNWCADDGRLFRLRRAPDYAPAVVGFGLRSVPDAVSYIGGLVAAIVGIVAATRGVRRWIWPKPPDVIVTNPGASLSSESITDRDGSERRRWVKVEPTYSIENNSGPTIYDVKTGVRKRDGSAEHVFDASRIPLIKEGVPQRVNDAGSIPPAWLEPVEGENPHLQFVYWARFRTDGRVWETRLEPPDPQPKYRLIRRRASTTTP